MIFHFYQYPANRIPPINLELNDIHIDKETIFNFLGIHIDENISWKAHIDYICNKLSKTTGIFKRLHYTLPTNALLHMYNSLVSSHLNYGLLVYGFDTERLF